MTRPANAARGEATLSVAGQILTLRPSFEALVAADPGHDDASGDHDDTVEHPIAQPVGMRRRAWPLLTMLRLAREKGEDVTWEPAPSW